MSAAVPSEIRDIIKQKIWNKADELGWSKLPDFDRATWYENWSKDKDIGGALSHFMDTRKIRVYIKDSLLKPYLRSRIQDDWPKVAATLGVPPHENLHKRKFEKPCGVQLPDGKIISWGHSRDWKSILVSVFERSFGSDESSAYGAALIETGKTTNAGLREMIVNAGQRLGVEKIVWIE